MDSKIRGKEKLKHASETILADQNGQLAVRRLPFRFLSVCLSLFLLFLLLSSFSSAPSLIVSLLLQFHVSECAIAKQSHDGRKRRGG